MPLVERATIFVLGIVFPNKLPSRQLATKDTVLERIEEAVLPCIELLVVHRVVEDCFFLVLMEKDELGGCWTDAVTSCDATIRVGLFGSKPFPTGLLALGLCERFIFGAPAMITQNGKCLLFCIHFNMNHGLEDITPDGDCDIAL